MEYDTRLTTLEDHKSLWASKKKTMEDNLTMDKDIAEVLKWIKKDDDPEMELEEIGSKATSDERYNECAEWILSRPEFQDWSNGWYSSENQRASKRVIWIHGPCGTGKTTIMYVALLLRLKVSHYEIAIA